MANLIERSLVVCRVGEWSFSVFKLFGELLLFDHSAFQPACKMH